jgi:signal transduction histidine kinase
VQLIVQSAEDLPDISIDEMRMLQVMGNLMTNALRYTPDGGIVTLSASAMETGRL